MWKKQFFWNKTSKVILKSNSDTRFGIYAKNLSRVIFSEYMSGAHHLYKVPKCVCGRDWWDYCPSSYRWSAIWKHFLTKRSHFWVDVNFFSRLSHSAYFLHISQKNSRTWVDRWVVPARGEFKSYPLSLLQCSSTQTTQIRQNVTFWEKGRLFGKLTIFFSTIVFSIFFDTHHQKIIEIWSTCGL